MRSRAQVEPLGLPTIRVRIARSLLQPRSDEVSDPSGEAGKFWSEVIEVQQGVFVDQHKVLDLTDARYTAVASTSQRTRGTVSTTSRAAYRHLRK